MGKINPMPMLYEQLVGLDAPPPVFARDIRRFHWDDATVKVDWALSAPVRWTAAGARGAGTVHVGVDLDGMSGYSSDLARGRLPHTPFVLIGQMTTSDPAVPRPVPNRCGRTPTFPSSWLATAGSCASRPSGSRSSSSSTHPASAPGSWPATPSSPADLRRHNPSLVGGAVNGGTAAAHQQLFFRPVPGLGRADTPIDRLYLASSSAHPGGGVHGAPGANAARAALARNGVAGRPYAAAVRAAHRRLYH
jgi:phytoene dehydrogenase-like protein